MNHSKLKTPVKMGYGFAETGITAVQLFTQIYLLKFYTEIVGLNASLAGIALSISVIWDAISDPLMGRISDHTRTRFGRRRPYIFIGGILLSIAVLLLFSPPEIASQLGKFIYLLSVYLLVNTAMTIISVPHIALGGELSFERDERTSVFGWRLFFSNIGMLIGMIVPAAILQSLGDETAKENIITSRTVAGEIVSLVILVSSIITFWVTKGKDKIQTDRSKQLPFFISFGSVLKNKMFLVLLFAFVIATIGRTFNSAIALYYYEYRLGLKESQVVINILLPFFLVLMLSIGFWVWISKKIGKKIPAFFGVFGLGLLTVIVYPLFPYGELRPPLIAAFFGGIFAGSILIMDSILTDVVDYDEFQTGEKREGLYFGIWKMGVKFSQAFGIAITGFLLDIIGFQNGMTTQTPEVGFRLALIFGPGVGFFFIFGSIIFLFFPLTDAKHIQVQRILTKRTLKKETR
ncbi:Na+/melibiose symporter-related transporter [Leptospira biflexa serovar Patoc strain 'Patoc 1 (Ames)']|uniref:Permease, MFS superfamily n=1 Tax=Leptospira biflexa serovar Patoc (strain Patoc 1 / ATCC 23582 / Paris) TaxID=456481 RepID=B0SJA0_LEPBP|nr:MFS transporter [Leptospira biflexa]ABZ93107.1 Na+/melibiose symporter-related transporter [Leptospira biflexa serovar Patoc strain 'Patoc 1 (Ames)']ABZ96729.1 Permease, MFS superfamily [Leptospira biflexa serovar Patoc strain 'Patoc 1 (Paris)']